MIPSLYGGPEDLVLQAVVVSVGYSDFLAQTLPENLGLLDQIVVVTDPNDKATQALCRRLSVPCVISHEFYVGGDNFNKGRAINHGLAHLLPGGWRLQLDADIVLPPQFRQMLRKHPLDKSCIYGADRINVHGWKTWQRIKANKHRMYNYHYMVTPLGGPGTSHGSRLVHADFSYNVIGYFQLWHSSAGQRYPINQGSAEHTDVLFSMAWPREKRHLLPELYVWHLEVENQADRANWHGRVTPQFEPPPEMRDSL